MNTFKNPIRFGANRDFVNDSYKTAITKHNNELIKKGKELTAYTYPNQKQDANTILNIFYNNMYPENSSSLRVISIIKRTKVGCNGLMIEIAKNISTHSDDNFIIMCENVFFITGMSNKSWEEEFIKDLPSCFSDNVYHHGKLKNFEKKIKELKNALIIIDEIDTGDKEGQCVHKSLEDARLLDIEYMEDNNIRFIFVSATIRNQLKELRKWGDKHKYYTMTIPENYISHGDFLEKKIIKEFYPIKNIESATKWIEEDILDYYNEDYRVHIIRTDLNNIKHIEEACKNKNITSFQ